MSDGIAAAPVLVGRGELLAVLCREVARIAEASAVRVRLVELPGQPPSVTEYGSVGERTIELPLRVGTQMLGAVEFSVEDAVAPGAVVHVDALVSVAAAALAGLAGVATARSEARRDALTGLGNRRAFEEDLATHLVANACGDLTLALLDLDDLKGINGREGHAGGDAALRALARSLSECTRDRDAAYRIGGDEFALLLEADSERAAEIVARIRAGAGDWTFSAGIATGERPTASALLAAADLALLAAKRQGKNVTLLAPPPQVVATG